MRTLILNPQVFQLLAEESRRAFPREACGLVVGRPADPASHRALALENLADRLHAQDPQTHPRDGRTAYVMDPLKVQRLADEAEARGEALVAIFHSHPQHPAYFSRTDQAAASPWGSPTWPDAWQLVVSVFDGEVRDLKGFTWDGAEEVWEEGELLGLPPLPGPPPGARPLGDV